MKYLVVLQFLLPFVRDSFAIQCGVNEVLLNEGVDCGKCSNYAITGACLPQNETKCYCKNGYVRHDESNECVKVSSCPGTPGKPLPPPCTVNETLASEGYDCGTCENPPFSCRRGTYKKCYCKENYVRNKDGFCISKTDCRTEPPLICGINEVASSCVNPCAPTCDRPNPPICEFLVCNKGCVCQKGYIRETRSGACIREEICPKNCAKRNAEFSTCASRCPITCQNKDRGDTVCITLCEYGCVCEGETIWNNETGNCTCINDCPK